MTSKPKPIRFTLDESGRWYNWENAELTPIRISAVEFEDGSIFDAVTGWREKSQKEISGREALDILEETCIRWAGADYSLLQALRVVRKERGA